MLAPTCRRRCPSPSSEPGHRNVSPWGPSLLSYPAAGQRPCACPVTLHTVSPTCRCRSPRSATGRTLMERHDREEATEACDRSTNRYENLQLGGWPCFGLRLSTGVAQCLALGTCGAVLRHASRLAGRRTATHRGGGTGHQHNMYIGSCTERTLTLLEALRLTTIHTACALAASPHALPPPRPAPVIAPPLPAPWAARSAPRIPPGQLPLPGPPAASPPRPCWTQTRRRRHHHRCPPCWQLLCWQLLCCHCWQTLQHQQNKRRPLLTGPHFWRAKLRVQTGPVCWPSQHGCGLLVCCCCCCLHGKAVYCML